MPSAMTSNTIPLPGSGQAASHAMPQKPTQPAYTTHISGTTDVKKYEKSIISNCLQASNLLVIGFSLHSVA